MRKPTDAAISNLQNFQHTPNHTDCPACAALVNTNIMGLSPEVPFLPAAEAWLEVHSTYIKQRTIHDYRQNIKTLTMFLGEMKLAAISIATVRGYQQWRTQAACPTRVNYEVSTLQQVLREAGLWDRIGLLYRPLPVPKRKVRQNMSEDEERRLIAVALDSGKPRRLLAGHCLIVMANTTMGFGELRHVRRQDIHLENEPPLVEVNGGSKNDYRIRAIPLNFLALRSMRWMVKRWADLGGDRSDQYILPHRASIRGGETDFYEPMGHIRRAATAIFKEAGLSHLDPYDMRSHAITKILSDPNCSDQVYEEIAGHSGRQMRMRYSKQRLEKKALVMERMSARFAAGMEARKLVAFPGGRGA